LVILTGIIGSGALGALVDAYRWYKWVLVASLIVAAGAGACFSLSLAPNKYV
jgi:hypothetical protein